MFVFCRRSSVVGRRQRGWHWDDVTACADSCETEKSGQCQHDEHRQSASTALSDDAWW